MYQHSKVVTKGKQININMDEKQAIRRAQDEGNLHELLLDRRAKMKSDKYCWFILCFIHALLMLWNAYLQRKKGICSKRVRKFIENANVPHEAFPVLLIVYGCDMFISNSFRFLRWMNKTTTKCDHWNEWRISLRCCRLADTLYIITNPFYAFDTRHIAMWPGPGEGVLSLIAGLDSTSWWRGSLLDLCDNGKV